MDLANVALQVANLVANINNIHEQLGAVWKLLFAIPNHDRNIEEHLQASFALPRKYTMQNIQRMYEYLDYIPTVPQRHRKFVEEAAYSERDLIAKKGCKSRPASITHPKGGALLSIRQGTNKATHFADAILGAVHARHLLAGDRLILDNAGIHRAKKVIPALRVILSAVGVELVYLPKYSPEYNPAEFAFNWTKSNLKQNVTGESFLARIANAFAEEVTLERMTNAYEHCMP
eukprot:g72216.t1